MDIEFALNSGDFGERLKLLRRRCGFSQRQIAHALDVSSAAVCKWEYGQSVPRTALLVRLAAVLKVSIDELLGQTSECEPLIAPSAAEILWRARHDVANALSVDVKRVRIFVEDADISASSEMGRD